MKKQTAIELAGSEAELARIFGITQSAVSQWSDVLPEGRVWQLRTIRPKWFKKQKPIISSAGTEAKVAA